jgi:transposase
MTEEHSETTGLKVVTVGRDGKRRFDRQTKQKLVEACLEPGASVAGLALKHGVNANLLRKCKRRVGAVENSLDKRRRTRQVIMPLPEGIKARLV